MKKTTLLATSIFLVFCSHAYAAEQDSETLCFDSIVYKTDKTDSENHTVKEEIPCFSLSDSQDDIDEKVKIANAVMDNVLVRIKYNNPTLVIVAYMNNAQNMQVENSNSFKFCHDLSVPIDVDSPSGSIIYAYKRTVPCSSSSELTKNMPEIEKSKAHAFQAVLAGYENGAKLAVGDESKANEIAAVNPSKHLDEIRNKAKEQSADVVTKNLQLDSLIFKDTK
jgi:hypothetical protein